MGERLVNSDANTKRIGFVEQCFGSSGQPLAIPNRILIGEGVLTKMCRKKLKPRQFFLFNDILVYGSIVISKKKYNRQHILQLENITLQALPDDAVNSLYNGWQIKSPSKSFAIYAATVTEKTEWMSHINHCIHLLLTKHGRQSSTADPSPVWIPDSDALSCMLCRRSEFSIINRRHHCRKCGIVCCNACTSKRWMLPQQSSKPLRVCLSCYDKLSYQDSPRAVAWEPESNYGYKDTASCYGNAETSGEDSSDSNSETSDEKSEEQTMFYGGNGTQWGSQRIRHCRPSCLPVEFAFLCRLGLQISCAVQNLMWLLLEFFYSLLSRSFIIMLLTSLDLELPKRGILCQKMTYCCNVWCLDFSILQKCFTLLLRFL